MSDPHATDATRQATADERPDEEPIGLPRESKLPSDADATPAAAYADHLRPDPQSGTAYVDDAAALAGDAATPEADDEP